MDPQTSQNNIETVLPTFPPTPPVLAPVPPSSPAGVRHIRIIVAAIAVGVILLITILFIIMHQKKTTLQSATTSKVKSIGSQPIPVSITTIPTLAVTPEPLSVSTNQYRDKGFSIAYPAGWKVSAVTGSASFTEQLPEYRDSYRSIIISQANKDSETLLSVPAYMRNLHLGETQTTFQGIPAQKFSGTQMLRSFGQETSEKPYWDTVLLFTHSDDVFTIEYTYDGALENNQQEAFFTNLIATLKFN